MLHRIAATLLVLPVLVCLSAAAWAGKLGPEFRVNTFTASDQRGPSVARLTDGGFVVIWYSDGQDSSGFGVYGQRYDAAGAPVDGEFPVNTHTPDHQQSRSVAGLGDGGFVVTWESLNQDGSRAGVYGQRYRADGTPAGGEFPINTTTANHQLEPSVAALSNGGFVVTWESLGQDGSGYGVYGQLYRANGKPIGGEFPINTATAGDQLDTSVAALNGGGFVVTWSSEDQDGSGAGVYGRRFRANGSPAGDEFQVNTTTVDNQLTPSVAGLSDGGFVVAWTAEGNQDGSQHGIYGRRFRANGKAAGGEFPVNTTTENSQDFPSVAGLSDGGFVVAWTSFAQDGSKNGVFGQRFNAAGALVGAEFQANKHKADDQEVSAVAALDDGKFVVIWRSTGQDGSGTGIYGQRFGP